MTKKNKRVQQDAYYEREKTKYENPIFSREYILEFLSGHGVPILASDLVGLLKIESPEQKEALRRRVNAMVRDGQLFRNRRDGLCVVDKKDLIPGRVIGHPDGFGFLKPDEGEEDLFLSPRQMRALLHDDRALVRISGVDRKGRKEATLIEVLVRNTQQVVGRYYREDSVGFVVPDNKRMHQDIIIPHEHSGQAENGQIVMLELIEQPTKRSRPIGKIVEVLGHHMAPGMEVDVALRAHDIPYVWPEAVLSESAAFGDSVPESVTATRDDLRHLPFVTIDGEDARDFDDAVYCEEKPKGWRLLVAIADVSYYVTPNSALDKEAVKRGTSVYFPNRVVSMLPESLSNGLCSLNPGVDRLVMVCDMYIDRQGKILRSKFLRATIRSAARLTYTVVAEMMGQQPSAALKKQYQWFFPHLTALKAVFDVLLVAREARGAIDFETVETRILFGQDKKIEAIQPTQRNDAHRLIEECMIAANVAAARWLARKKLPTLYRVHNGPTEEKVNDVRAFLAEFGVAVPEHAKIEPKTYAVLIQTIRHRQDFNLIQTVLLRSLAQAAYSPENIGHFGLSHDFYAHFTSPIRRYPDLMVHRALCHVLTGGNDKNFRYGWNDLVTLGETCSMAERRADEATRDVTDWLKCEYMQDKLGDVYEGTIMGVTNFGIFVELKDIYVEGLVHITALDHDYYRFEPAGHRLRGEKTGKVYQLSDSLKVKVVRVNLDEKKIDFELADKVQKLKPKRKKKRRRSKS